MSQQPCLPVGKVRRTWEQDPSSTPYTFGAVDVQALDASEYLAMVAEQSRRLPEVFVCSSDGGLAAEPGTRAVKRKRYEGPIDGSAASLLFLVSERTAVAGPPTARHLPEDAEAWVATTLSNFSTLREYLERCQEMGIGGKDTQRMPVPAMNDRAGWHIFCVGKDGARGNEGSYFDDEAVGGEDDVSESDSVSSIDKADDAGATLKSQWEENVPSCGHVPTVPLLLQMDQVLVRRVLGHLIHYVTDGWSPGNAQRSAWIYALLSRMERPIHREDAAVLFGLLKSLCHTRAHMDITGDRVKLARINVLITIVGIYFEQGRGFDELMKPPSTSNQRIVR